MTLYDLKVAINSIPVTIDESSIITFERGDCEFEYGEVDLYFIPLEFEFELEVRLR